MTALLLLAVPFSWACWVMYHDPKRLYYKARKRWIDSHDLESKQVDCFHDFYNVKDRDTHEGQCWKCCLQEEHSLSGDEFNHYLDGYFGAYGQEW